MGFASLVLFKPMTRSLNPVPGCRVKRSGTKASVLAGQCLDQRATVGWLVLAAVIDQAVQGLLHRLQVSNTCRNQRALAFGHAAYVVAAAIAQCQ